METNMAEEAARPVENRGAPGPRPCRAARRRRRRSVERRARARASARRRSNSCAPIRATRARISTRPISTTSPPRSRSGASSSRCWFGRSRASPTPMRSSPASGAGARRSGPACMKYRSSSSRPAIAKRSNSPSSRTSSAPISMRSKRPMAMRSSAPITIIRTATSPASSARAAAISPTRCAC